MTRRPPRERGFPGRVEACYHRATMAIRPTVALVPARGGSKGIPRKNLRELSGKPLLGWAIDAGRRCPLIDRVIVTTDDEEIRRAALAAGAEAPFLRPAGLAADTTAMDPVVVHALEWLAEHDGFHPASVVLLQPTSPLRSAGHVTAALELLESSGAETVVSLCRTEHPPEWLRTLDGELRVRPFLATAGPSRRQDAAPVFRLNGAVVASLVEPLLSRRRLVGDDVRGLVMAVEDSVDVDTELDFNLAQVLFARRARSAADESPR